MRRRLLKRIAAGLALLVAVAAVAGFVVGGAGGFDTHPAPSELRGRAAPAGAPGWTRPCWAGRLRSDERNRRVCARLRARVIWVRRESTETGDGDAHLITVADRRIRHAKISLQAQGFIDVPSIGDAITVVGPVVGGAHVREQVNVWALREGL